jgi:hypothetical protein
MNEATWLACTDPQPMLVCCGKASGRKLRLYACACCRRVWRDLFDHRTRTALQVAERHADGMANREMLKIAAHGAHVVLQQRMPKWLAGAAHAVWVTLVGGRDQTQPIGPKWTFSIDDAAYVAGLVAFVTERHEERQDPNGPSR